ncbi:peptide/nickel transport system permease protein [Microbacterium terrae]|uniref:Glutathione transport system permease protein GsiC n=1 Tax=Microbacterium terrae TaxID=69369 RepID=A0A0M2GVH1_9MICO|nr:ABC transporter permease [Microbacterium terrae]KJL37497.1 Glutathione transport system permease protein GsiC [Microbacterium terrae]MBP1076326.1 peptide/nickel transport system permease protein [Microbacterium terrae]GLJ97150.1 ABC transporter permease [Microbacterium terrae]
MLWFILRRVASGVVLVAAISFIAYFLLYLAGGDIARRILGDTATVEVVAKKTTELGLDRPFFVRYSEWLGGALSGDLGRSWFTGELVSVSVVNRVGVTLSIVVGTIIISAVVSVVLGVLAARRGGWVDSLIQFITMLGFALPGFLIALGLVLVFAVELGWFKATGYIPLDDSVVGWLSSVTLPILALSFGAVAAVAQQIRGSVIDAMSRDYVRTLRSRGLPANSVIYRHVLRNAGGPALAVLALQFVGMLGGAVIIEQMFAIPGMGQLTVQSTVRGDIPVVMGLVIVFAIIVLIVNLVIDVAQAVLNPKVRLS